MHRCSTADGGIEHRPVRGRYSGVMTTSRPRTQPAAVRTERRSEELLDWARTVSGPVPLGEVEARIIRADRRLEKAVHAKAPASTRDPAPRPARCVWRALLAVLPAVPLLFAPSKHRWTHTVEYAERFGVATAVCFSVVAIVQFVLLAIWLVRPLHADMTRLLSALATLAMGAILPALLLMAGIIATPETWDRLAATVILPFLVAIGLAAANMSVTCSRRSMQHREAGFVAEMRRMLSQDPDTEGTGTGPRGTVRELRRVIRRLPDADQDTLRSRCDRVLGQLRSRGLITPSTEEAARARPLGSWHVLDR